MTNEEPKRKPKRKPLRKRIGIALLVVVLALLAMAMWQIDDWSRDLTTNSAETSVNAKGLLLRPIRVASSPEVVEAALHEFVDTHSQWEWVSSDASLPGWRFIRLTRTTKWLRFTDDVTINTIYTHPKETLIEVSSQSRIGKGDLGQNPRNIRELNAWLREELGGAAVGQP
ncbi:DUF1499 domain-containing protein [Adhaeretor mobilis]|uniref:DUF1499 domain-containing protein n=1 Tax=Adhaeretor mobilis TaxID=1930276 RepID=A0A517N1L0_9BACT|nr:DUF1499 domain-containing protein [Adhaeretor mobilis]QDT01022.1 hypothetical protein HG15A2_43640 [Adhaeretor mobilis]